MIIGIICKDEYGLQLRYSAVATITSKDTFSLFWSMGSGLNGTRYMFCLSGNYRVSQGGKGAEIYGSLSNLALGLKEQ
jgi:hypothetical protein